MAEGMHQGGDDLSAGENPPPQELKKANALLSDAESRRRYRIWSFWLAVVVVVFFGMILFRLARAIISHIDNFSPWVVGFFATLVVAMTLMVMSLLRATFSAPETDTSGRADSMPQSAALSDVFKIIGNGFETMSKVFNGK